MLKQTKPPSLDWEREQKFKKKNSREVKMREVRTEVRPEQEVIVGTVGGPEQPPFTPIKDKRAKTQTTQKDPELHEMNN